MPIPWRSVDEVTPQYEWQSWRSVNGFILRHGNGSTEECVSVCRSTRAGTLRKGSAQTTEPSQTDSCVPHGTQESFKSKIIN